MSDTATMLRDHAGKLIGYEELDDLILFLYRTAGQFDNYEQITKMRVDTIEILGKKVKKLEQEVTELKGEKVTIDRVIADIPVDNNLVASWKEKIR